MARLPFPVVFIPVLPLSSQCDTSAPAGECRTSCLTPGDHQVESGRREDPRQYQSMRPPCRPCCKRNVALHQIATRLRTALDPECCERCCSPSIREVANTAVVSTADDEPTRSTVRHRRGAVRLAACGHHRPRRAIDRSHRRPTHQRPDSRVAQVRLGPSVQLSSFGLRRCPLSQACVEYDAVEFGTEWKRYGHLAVEPALNPRTRSIPESSLVVLLRTTRPFCR